jgi:hypothetical protein
VQRDAEEASAPALCRPYVISMPMAEAGITAVAYAVANTFW